jgi:signal transduction histidine kinase
VSDTGSGIPEKDLPYIFERFYRADEARAAATGGAGLGLAIVKRIVEDHGGQVFASSVEGRGSAIGFVLPVLAYE